MGQEKWLGAIRSSWEGCKGLVGGSQRGPRHLSGEQDTGKPAIAGNAQGLLLSLCSAAENLQHDPFEQTRLADCIPPPTQGEAGGQWLCGAAHPGDLLIAGNPQQAVMHDRHKVHVLMAVKVQRSVIAAEVPVAGNLRQNLFAELTGDSLSPRMNGG